MGQFLLRLQSFPSPRLDSVYRQFLASLATRDLVGASKWRDLSAIAAHRDSILVWSRRARPPRAVTVEDLMRQDPTMPQAVAEYNFEQMRRAMAQHPMPAIPAYPTIPSLDSLRSLAPLNLGAAWLRGHDYREQYREDVRRMRCVDSLAVVTTSKRGPWSRTDVGQHGVRTLYRAWSAVLERSPLRRSSRRRAPPTGSGGLAHPRERRSPATVRDVPVAGRVSVPLRAIVVWLLELLA